MKTSKTSDPAPSPGLNTDEWFDRVVSRPLAGGLVRLVRHTPLTANQITGIAGLVGVAAGYGLSRGTSLSLALAAAGCIAFLVLDCADGQLARLRGGGSRFGRMLDGACDYLCVFSLHVGALVYLLRTAHDGFPALSAPFEIALVVVAGLLMAVRAGIYDDLKGRVRQMSGAAKDERDDPERLRAEIRAETRPLVRFVLRVYLVYCRLQSAPETADPPSGELAPAVRTLRAWSFLGPTTHVVALAVATALSVRWPDALRWYFLVAVGPASVVMILLRPGLRRLRVG